MKSKITFLTLEITLLIVIAKDIQAEPVDPCRSNQDDIIADMCTDDSVVEGINYGSRVVDSVLLRITEQQDNCICHVSLQNNATNYTIYMSKYEGLSISAPEQQNCGLAVDVEYIDTSDIAQFLPPIECTSGISMRSIELGDGKLIFRSRIIGGDFTRGYCMQVFKNQAVVSCKMNDQANTAGSDGDWIVTNGQQHASLDGCKRYCLQTKACVAVHFQLIGYCFVYNRTTKTVSKDDSTYSQKHCVDTEKLEIKCYPPETTTQSSQETTTDDYFSAKLETVSRPIGNSHVTSYNTQSTIARENAIIKETSTSFMVVLVIAIIGCIVAVFFAGTTVFYKRKLHTQNSNIVLAARVNYVDLSRARDDSDYSAINSQAVNEQQYETVNQRT